MNINILYISPNGTTQKTASLLEMAFLSKQHLVSVINIGKSPYREDSSRILQEINTADIVGFGSAAYHMDMMEPMIQLFSLIRENHSQFHFRSFFFINYSGITTGKTFLINARQFESAGMPICGSLKIIAPHFHHKADFPTETTRSTINNFVDALERKKYAAMSSDQIEKEFKPFTRKTHFIYPLIHLIGKKRELPITIDQKICKLCGKCVRECPAGAIVQNGRISIDLDKCLHCYHCSVACPKKAIHSPLEKLDKMMQTNIKIIGMEQPGDHFYV